MPGFDGTGPMGMGPMTGGGRGFCSGYMPMGMGGVMPTAYWPRPAMGGPYMGYGAAPAYGAMPGYGAGMYAPPAAFGGFGRGAFRPFGMGGARSWGGRGARGGRGGARGRGFPMGGYGGYGW